MKIRWVVAAALSLLISACADPLEGSWESEADALCLGGAEPATFVVGPDLRGDGEVCNCDFSFAAVKREDGDYEVDIDFEDECLLPDSMFDCEIVERATGLELDCEEFGVYEKQE